MDIESEFRTAVQHKRKRVVTIVDMTKKSKATDPTKVSSDDHVEATEIASPEAEPKKEKIPPIIFDSPKEWLLHSKALTGLMTGQLKAVSTPLSMRILPDNEEDYRVIQSYLQSKGVAFHTYQLPKDKEVKVVIRGVPFHIPLDDVSEELKTSGHDVVKVARLTTRDGKETPTLLICLKRGPEVRKIYDLTNLFYCRVEVTHYVTRRGLPQCHRCQRFGHSSRYCTRQHRCVKCGADHDTAVCEKTKEEQPTCPNCKGQHPANYRGCPYYKQLMARTTSAGQPKMQQKKTITHQNKVDGRSWASVANPQPGTSRQQQGTPSPTPPGASGPTSETEEDGEEEAEVTDERTTKQNRNLKQKSNKTKTIFKRPRLNKIQKPKTQLTKNKSYPVTKQTPSPATSIPQQSINNQALSNSIPTTDATNLHTTANLRNTPLADINVRDVLPHILTFLPKLLQAQNVQDLVQIIIEAATAIMAIYG